ncbi:MAG TPA: hypothetical protein VMV04_17570 [Thermodesulfobacteriota bacterium]|nr:hypothetical protein [Thermodesulfobacteriota bacterium]
MRRTMTSADIIAKVAEEIKVSRTVAGKALALIIDSIVEPKNRGEEWEWPLKR